MKPKLKRVLIIMAVPLTVFVLFCLLLFAPKAIVVSSRVVIFDQKTTEEHVKLFRGSGWYKNLKKGGYFVPESEMVKQIDDGLGTYLKRVATEDPAASKFAHFTKGIESIITNRNLWGGQFMGVTKVGGQESILCFYSLIEGEIPFQDLPYVPYVSDGNGRNFHFFYDIASQRETDFYISGSDAGPFGEVAPPDFSSLGRAKTK